MSELQTEYADQVTFTIVDPAVTNESGDVEAYELETHGLVAFDAEGNVVHTIPGHKFGRDEIVEAIGKVTGGS